MDNQKFWELAFFFPSQIVTSISLMEEIQSDKRFGIPLNWVDKKIGIEERRVAAEGTLPSDMATSASIEALKNASINPGHLSLIIYCGIEKDFMEPGTAHVVQKNLGSNAVCMDVTNACQGIISGISVADSMIGSGCIDNALICSGELASKSVKKFLNKIKNKDASYLRDRLGVMTVGDAGSAVILTRKKMTLEYKISFLIQEESMPNFAILNIMKIPFSKEKQSINQITKEIQSFIISAELFDSMSNEKENLSLKSLTTKVEKLIVDHAVEITNGSQVQAASLLGVSTSSICRKKNHEIKKPA